MWIQSNRIEWVVIELLRTELCCIMYWNWIWLDWFGANVTGVAWIAMERNTPERYWRWTWILLNRVELSCSTCHDMCKYTQTENTFVSSLRFTINDAWPQMKCLSKDETQFPITNSYSPTPLLEMSTATMICYRLTTCDCHLVQCRRWWRCTGTYLWFEISMGLLKITYLRQKALNHLVTVWEAAIWEATIWEATFQPGFN